MRKTALALSLAGAAAFPAMAADPATIDWSKVPAKIVTLFYPGQSSFEWLNTDHKKAESDKGMKAVQRGQSCLKCHGDDEKKMGESLVKGGPLEPMPVKGKNGWRAGSQESWAGLARSRPRPPRRGARSPRAARRGRGARDGEDAHPDGGHAPLHDGPRPSRHDRRGAGRRDAHSRPPGGPAIRPRETDGAIARAWPLIPSSPSAPPLRPSPS